MDFDIHQIDRLTPDSDGAGTRLDTFGRELIERFSQSPEGQERLRADPDMGFWAEQLMHYAFDYEGAVISEMTVRDVRTVVAELFPSKISLRSPEEADNAIPGLIAFWKYLKREFNQPHADAVLKFLNEVAPEFHGMMNDSSNFGMAKSILALGRDGGFDMSTQEGINAFMLAFNTGQLGRPSLPIAAMSNPRSARSNPSVPPPHHLDLAARKAERKKRQRQEEAKKGKP